MARRYILLCIVGMLAFLTFSAIAQEHANSASSPNVVAPAPAVETGTTTETTHKSGMTTAAPDVAVERALRLEGEKRFRTNCERCHQPPHKFPPRVMAAAIRHMRVRAMITDEDMRLILKYITQ